MAAAATPMAGALATTAFANQDDPTDTGDDLPEPDVKVTDTSSSGLNPSDPNSIAEFTKKINDLMARLNDSPEKTEKARTLAWAGGLNDPSGNGSLASGVVNAAKAESEFDYKDKALRAQYTPLIVNALTQQQQFAAQQKILNQPGGVPSLVGMPVDQAQRLNVALPGFKIMENWKLANPQGVTKGGSWRSVPDANGGMRQEYFPTPKDNITMTQGPEGPASVIQGAPAINAATHAANSFAGAAGTTLGGTVEGMNDAGVSFKLPGISAFGGSYNNNPFLSGPLAQYAGQNNPQAAANGPLAHPEQQPPAQTPPPPQGPPSAQGAPGGAPQAGNPAIPPQLPGAVGGGATPPAIRQAPPPEQGMRGGFDTSNPAATIQAIAKIPNPQERANAFKAFMQQVQGDKQPPFQPGNGQAVQLSGPPPVANGAEAPANQPPMRDGSFNSNGLPPNALQTSQSSATKIANEATGDFNKEFFAKKLPGIQEAGTNLADANIQALNTAQVALKNLGKTGWGTDGKVAAAKVLAAMGFAGATEYASDAEKFTKAVYQNNLNILQAQKGSQSDNDAANVAKTYAQLGSQEKTNQYILDTSRAIEERKKMQASYYTNGVPIAKAEHGGDMSVIDSQWMKNAPPISAMPSMAKYAAEFRKAGIDPRTGRLMQ